MRMINWLIMMNKMWFRESRRTEELKSKVGLVLLLLFCVLSGCTQNKEVITNDNWAIEVSDSLNNTALRAAGILEEYLVEMLGQESEGEQRRGRAEEQKSIEIRINDSLPDDAYVLQWDDDVFTIQGGAGKGCIYGVVRLLEEWGIRKYSPSFEIIPNKKNLKFPEEVISSQPVNNYRIINGRFCQDKDYQDWQALDLIDDQFAKGYYVHTFRRLLPWQDYFDSHPEYYAWMNGKRIIDQLCLTNPDVLKLVIEKLEVEMAKQPEKVLWSVSQDDNFSYCQCEHCSKVIEEEVSAAGTIIRFVNEIARRFPDKTISTLAYQYSRQAPVLTKPEPNVQVMLCTIELNRSEAIEIDERSAGFVKDIRDWGQIANNIYLWDYTVNFSHHITPFPNLHVLQPNIQFFTANNVRQHFQQSNTDVGHEFSELKSYLIAHLLWNPDVSVDSLKNDFLKGYYGKASQEVQAYLDALQGEILKTGEWLDIYGHPTAHENTFLSEENRDLYFELFTRAKKKVRKDSARLIHVKTAMLPVQYASMEIGKNHLFDEPGMKEQMAEMLESFIATCREAGVRSVNEAGLSPEEYYESTRRFLETEIDGNLAFRKKVVASPLPAEKYSKGDLDFLTNGVKGSNDFKVHWLGWEAQDFELILDLEEPLAVSAIRISSLYDPKSWIFHPNEITCEVSANGNDFMELGSMEVGSVQKNETVTRDYVFKNASQSIQFIRFTITGTRQNPEWHPSAGGDSWVFIDEIIVTAK